MTPTHKNRLNRRSLLKGAAASTVGILAAPMVVRAESKSIKVGMTTILSGRVAQLGTSSRNAVMMEVEKINAAGGLAGRQIEMVIRDSKGQPQEAARIARELINTEGCELLIDAEASSGAFAVHEVARDLGMLTLHTNSETSLAQRRSETAAAERLPPRPPRRARRDRRRRLFGKGRQGQRPDQVDDYVAGLCLRPRHHRRVHDLRQILQSGRGARRRSLAEAVPAGLYRSPHQDPADQAAGALFCLWGGDLTAFIDQGNIYALFQQTETFAVNMADYTALTAVKNLPKGIHSGDRYIKTFPNTPENAAWGDAYRAKYNEYPTNWSWENASAMHFLAAAAKKANSADGAKLAEALAGLTIKSPFGTDGHVTLRADDQTIVGYAIGWGTTIPSEPYVTDMTAGDWKQIFELEADWKKKKNYT